MPSKSLSHKISHPIMKFGKLTFQARKLDIFSAGSISGKCTVPREWAWIEACYSCVLECLLLASISQYYLKSMQKSTLTQKENSRWHNFKISTLKCKQSWCNQLVLGLLAACLGPTFLYWEFVKTISFFFPYDNQHFKKLDTNH